MKNYQQHNWRIEPQMLAQLKKESQDSGTTVSNILRKAAREYLKAQKKASA